MMRETIFSPHPSRLGFIAVDFPDRLQHHATGDRETLLDFDELSPRMRPTLRGNPRALPLPIGCQGIGHLDRWPQLLRSPLQQLIQILSGVLSPTGIERDQMAGCCLDDHSAGIGRATLSIFLPAFFQARQNLDRRVIRMDHLAISRFLLQRQIDGQRPISSRTPFSQQDAVFEIFLLTSTY
jgi:hypothetical protein